MFDFDLFTIGAGSGGVSASRRAASYGLRVGICERGRVGGTCVIRGCIPKKLLMYGGQFRDVFEDASAFGWECEVPSFNWGTLLQNKNQEVSRLHQVYIKMLEEAGVRLFQGDGRLLDHHTVEVGGRRYTTERILIASGGWPSRLLIPGAEVSLTSNEMLECESLPSGLTVLGGGYIAVEFASIFNALGVKVTVAIRGQHILNGFDDDSRMTLETEMSARGITFLTSFLPTRIEESTKKLSTVYAKDGRSVTNERVLMATGRRPNISCLGTTDIGVKVNEKGAIQVDEWSCTSVPNIYAIGDVTDRVPLTPVAIAEGRAFVETVYNNNPLQIHYHNIPSAVFSLPPLATLGLTETQARNLFDTIDVYQTHFRPLKNTLSGRKERILIKMITERSSDRVLGCHMVGQDAPEIIQSLAVALTCGATKKQFDQTMALHPSAAEEFVTLR